MNATRDNAVMHNPDTQLARRRAYSKSRREQLRLNRETLLRSAIYRFCTYLAIVSVPVICLGMVANFFTVGTQLDVVGLMGLIVGPAALLIAVGLALALKLLVLPIYECIRRELELRKAHEDCALCIIGEPHN